MASSTLAQALVMDNSDSADNRFYYKDMIPVPLAKACKVIVGNFASFNKLLVIPCSAEPDLLELNDAIVERAEEADLTDDRYKNMPEVGEIVLAKGGQYNKFNRALILEVLESSWKTGFRRRAKVRFIDLGEVKVVELAEMISPNEIIMAHPVYGREVTLNDVPDNNDLILWEDFQDFIVQISKRVAMDMIECDEDETNIFQSPPTVELFRRSSRRKRINDEILELGKWEWEHQFEAGCNTDDKIIELKHEKSELKIFYQDLGIPKFPIGSEMEFKVLKSADGGILMLFALDDKYQFQHDLKVVETQITKYCSVVEPSAFFPELNQLMFLNTGEKWVRAARISTDILLLIDYGIFFPYANRSAQMRAFPLDFARIPGLALWCELDEWKNDLPPEEVLKPETTHLFTVGGLEPDTGVYKLTLTDNTNMKD